MGNFHPHSRIDKEFMEDSRERVILQLNLAVSKSVRESFTNKQPPPDRQSNSRKYGKSRHL